MSSYAEKVKKAIPSEIRMISLATTKDSPTSDDISQFELPHTAANSGGAATSAFLRVMNAEKGNLTWFDVWKKLKAEIKTGQMPELSASRPLNMDGTVHIVPPNFQKKPKKRAVLIGISYIEFEGRELVGCHEGVLGMQKFLTEKLGFESKDVTVLADDQIHHKPTRANILKSLHLLAQESKKGDVAFVYFAGHVGRFRDDGEDENGGKGKKSHPLEAWIPEDFVTAGVIRDDVLYQKFVCVLKEGVTTTCLIDGYHSGTAMELPYRFAVSHSKNEKHRMDMAENLRYDVEALLGLAVVAAVVVGGAALVTSAASDPGFGGCCDECCQECFGALFSDSS